jgi:hypothetical protein
MEYSIAPFFERFDDLGHGGALLADHDIDAVQLLALVITLVQLFLVQDGVEAMAVLPVWRSPMISSRWPRPTGIMESIALMPVAIGS